jgi:hypothetical protein
VPHVTSRAARRVFRCEIDTRKNPAQAPHGSCRMRPINGRQIGNCGSRRFLGSIFKWLVETLLKDLLPAVKEFFEPFAAKAYKLMSLLVWEWLSKHHQIVLSFFLTIFLFLLVSATFLTIHLALTVRKRRAHVFVSFQHDRESVANALAAEMATAGILDLKIPYVESPDHDDLLERIKHAIRTCDLFGCLPAGRPSFVENEVSMAFGLEKPLVFLVDKDDAPRLPNTAKKAYPIFALERLEAERFRTLVGLLVTYLLIGVLQSTCTRLHSGI